MEILKERMFSTTNRGFSAGVIYNNTICMNPIAVIAAVATQPLSMETQETTPALTNNDTLNGV
jgi:hypothetical protein